MLNRILNQTANFSSVLEALDKIKPNEKTGLVLYTDGGSRLNRKIAGWGIHGYFYDVDAPATVFKKRINSPSNFGYYDGRKFIVPGPGSKVFQKNWIGSVQKAPVKGTEPVVPTFFVDVLGPIFNETVSIAEMTALGFAIDLIGKSGVRQAALILDSEYCLNAITQWYPNWLRNGGRKSNNQPVEHFSLWTGIVNGLNKLSESGVAVALAHVNSHMGEPGNEGADYNASIGQNCQLIKNRGGSIPFEDYQFILKEAKNYAVKSKLNCRLIEQSWWYGKTNSDEPETLNDGRYVYYFGNHGKAEEDDNEIGKFTASAKIAILGLSEPEPVLDMISDYLKESYPDNDGHLFLGYAQQIFHTERYATLKEKDKFVLYPELQENRLKTPDKVTVIKELSPPYFGYRLLEKLESHQALLERFCAMNRAGLINDGGYCITDITDKVYRQVQKGKKLEWKTTPEVDAPSGTVKFPVNYNLIGEVKQVPIKFKLGTDIPQRNTLAAVAGDDTRIYAFTWRESTTKFKYLTILEADGHVLLTSALVANSHIFTGVK